MRIIALLFAFMLTGCAGDRLTAEAKPMTKCETVSALLSNPSATRGQVATRWKWAEITGALVLDRLEQKSLGGLTSPQRWPVVPAALAASLPHGHADHTLGRGWRGTDAAIDIVVSRA